ncbi:Na+/H+ antiporter subunit E [Arenimonas fontis]|uniref:Na+/H+ antiporter subunit E n=1 Tax=Arenimonas fontis TaxID=2608255 RepID=A0A5B2ZA65_9GAMM|nr:Na+/H+ antiporter subunit E [Arenimonas fontis]KAA2285036.1 Na+/H+ antiporter subunit E [Arenimonas fontis]
MNLRRWLPSPPLSLTICVFWLLMMDSITVGNVLLAAALGLVIPPWAARLDREFARIGRLRPVPLLLLVLAKDIVLSNIEVARRVLGREDRIRPAFVWYPLDIANIHGITALASFITLTPGTVSAALSHDRKYLLIHVFNLQDEAALVAQIKRRYERPLMEIFP